MIANMLIASIQAIELSFILFYYTKLTLKEQTAQKKKTHNNFNIFSS
jgi:hypothetical protein